MSFFDFLLIMAALAFAWFAGIVTAFWVIKKRDPIIYDYLQAILKHKEEGQP